MAGRWLAKDGPWLDGQVEDGWWVGTPRVGGGSHTVIYGRAAVANLFPDFSSYGYTMEPLCGHGGAVMYTVWPRLAHASSNGVQRHALLAK